MTHYSFSLVALVLIAVTTSAAPTVTNTTTSVIPTATGTIHSSVGINTTEVNSPLAGGYFSTCSDVTSDGTVLVALCLDGAGVGQPTSLDMNNCLENSDGLIVWPEYV